MSDQLLLKDYCQSSSEGVELSMSSSPSSSHGRRRFSHCSRFSPHAFIATTTSSLFIPHHVRLCRTSLPRYHRHPAPVRTTTSCTIDSNNDEYINGSANSNENSNASLFQTWRNPRWMNCQQHPSFGLRSSSPITPIFSLSVRQLPLKLLCAVAIATFIPALIITYARFNSYARTFVTIAVRASLDRPLHVGRISRCNPFTGIRLVDVVLPRSERNLTAPVISAKHVDITFSGFFRAVAFRTPLNLDISLNHANIQVSQRVVNGPKGSPIGQWNSGLISSSASASSTASLLSPISNEPTLNVSPDPALIQQLLRFIQPGTLSVRNAFVTFHPADVQDYGHGDEPVHVRNASATMTFPDVSFNSSPTVALPIKLQGDFHATVKGTPIDGGNITMVWSARGDTLFELQPEDIAFNMQVTGQGVHADRVASFLCLPFRADAGRCAADIEMDFLYKSTSLVPLVRGSATLNGVALRFHPDPKTPEFNGIDCTLRFVGKRMYMEDAKGTLGSLPMIVVGSIHLEDGYDLKGYASPVDVNNILDTFDVEKFVPVQGTVGGEVVLTGTLDEPMVSGRAQSVRTDKTELVFDRLPLKSAQLTFDWDAVAGVLRYPEILGVVKGGGTVMGSGCMYFDMTKENKWDIRQESHNERNPKAEYWNGMEEADTLRKILPSVPSDVMEIDDFAPYREYDSMNFSFRAFDIDGGDLLKYFGGEYGEIAKWALGRVSGEAVLAGHVKDANCRVLWRSVSPPPEMPLSDDECISDPSLLDKTATAGATPILKSAVGRIESSSELPNADVPSTASTESEPSKEEDTEIIQKPSKKRRHKQEQHEKNLSRVSNMPGSYGGRLGGGNFNGLVYMKLGDPLEARRVKARTIVREFDARRTGWASDELRKILKLTPYLETGMDTFFKGTMFQRAVLPPGVKKMPRTPRMLLMGLDGTLAVRGLKLNDISFDHVMSGSFSFGTNDFAISLRQVETKVTTEEEYWQLISGIASNDGDVNQADIDESSNISVKGDELMLVASSTGEGKVNIRRGKSELVGSLVRQETVLDKNSNDDNECHIGILKSRNIVIQDIIGRHLMTNNGAEALTGTVDVDVNVDVKSCTCDGTILVRDASFGSVQLSSIGGNIVWDGDEISLINGHVKQRNSEYRMDGRYGKLSTSSMISSATDDFESKLNVGILHADFKDVSKLVQNANELATSLQTPLTTYVGKENQTKNYLNPKWLQKLVKCVGDEDAVGSLKAGRTVTGTNRWDVPSNLSVSEKAEWLMRVAEEKKELERMGRLKKRTKRSRKAFEEAKEKHRLQQSLPFFEGAFSGQVSLTYNSKGTGITGASTTAASRWSSSFEDNKIRKGGILLQALLDELAKTTFSFEVFGEDCRIGDMPLHNVSASGLFEEGVLTLGPLSFEGEDGQEKFGADADARITRAGGVNGSIIVRNAPAALVQKYSGAPVRVSGTCNGRLEVEGNLANPRALGRLVWTEASLNGEMVRDARGDLACVNGRCLLNVNGRIGGRGGGTDADKQRVESLNWGTGVSDELKDLAKRTPSKHVEVDVDSGEERGRRRNRRQSRATVSGKEKGDSKDGLHIQVSAPVRFYLVNYLRQRAQTASSSIWQVIEPVLGTSTAPSDDEWIVANVDVKKYGLILLNSIAPEVGWEGGDSDVRLRVSGSIERPVVAGRVSVSDGRMSPAVLEESLIGVKGAMVIEENGVVSLKSVSGRCGGKWVTMGGDMFLTKWHKQQVEQKLEKGEAVVERLSGSEGTGGNYEQKERPIRNRKRRRVVMGEVNEARGLLQSAEKGVNMEFGDVGVDFQKAVVSKVSGRVAVKGVVAEPSVGGSIVLSDGVVFLGNVGSVSSSSTSSSSESPTSSSILSSSKINDVKLNIDGTSRQGKKDKIGEGEDKAVKRTETNGDLNNSEGIKFNGLKVSLGRNMKMVQSFVLNIQTTGEMTVNGSKDEPDVEGNIRLVKGSVNLLASRMRVARGENSYVKLMSKDTWAQQGYNGEPEMVMRVVMEDDDLVVRIGECRTSAWMDSVQVRNKRRDMLFDTMTGAWDDEDFRTRIDDDGSNAHGGFRMKRMVINSLLRIGQVGGKFGKLEWRMFPAVVSGGGGGVGNGEGNVGGDGEFNFREDMGGGGRVDVGGVSVSVAKSVKGISEGRLEIRFGRWGRMRFGGDGKFLSTEIDLFGGFGRRQSAKNDVSSNLKEKSSDVSAGADMKDLGAD